MKPRQLWLWIVLAAGLFGFIFFIQRHKPLPRADPGRLLPELKAQAVTSIQVRPSGAVSLGIRAERTNHTWQLVEPLVYPAQETNVVRLIETLESLTPVTCITPAEIRNRPKADEEFGFAAPQASIIVQQGGYRAHLLVGSFTAPGDQVYVQVVAREGVYVLDAAWLKYLPRSANEWRDTTLIADSSRLDRLAVTNNARAFVLQRDTNSLWKMIWPLSSARADNARIEEALQHLAELRIRQFISDDPKPDLETLGLARPELELALSQGTNSAGVFQFGKPVTTATNEVYARRFGQDTIFTVASDSLSSWRGVAVNDFRDPHLLTLKEAVGAIEVRGEEVFTVRCHPDRTWRLAPGNTPVDTALVTELLSTLAGIQIVQFAKDVVNAPELPEFGLASPVLRYSLLLPTPPTSSVAPPGQPSGTNSLIVELDFGLATNVADKVFVRRTDESSVYAISTNDFARLPSAGWQLRERRLWNITEGDVAGLSIQQKGRTWELIRRGDHLWSIAPGSQGIINDLAVEETVRGLTRASVRSWVSRGTQNLERYGLDNPHRVTFLLKNGERLELNFGGTASSEAQYAAVKVDGETFVMELAWHLYRDVATYLSVP